ncbi:MAG: zinc-binding dehydrogenase [Actinobacteria bacterium]|nr:zinc-binding dehydrogenase [Actinomycetota bacterium]
MQAWVVRGDGEPAAVLAREAVAEPDPDRLAGLKLDLAGWVTDPALLGNDDPEEAALFATRTAAVAARPPYEDWVLLRVDVAALALPDVTMARGTYPVRVARPYITGQEAVGEVIDAPPAKAHLVGRRVVAVTMQPWGSLAPVCVGVGPVFEVPDGMTAADAAGLVIPAHTGYHAAVRRGGVAAGERVVVLGAAGGLGSAMVQIAAARGAEVIAVVGDDAKAAHVTALGARHAVVHGGGDVAAAVRAQLGVAPVDVVLDPVQGDMGPSARWLLAPDGRWVVCGHAGGLRPIDPHFYMQNHTIVGATLGGYTRDVMRAMEHEAQDTVVAWWREGRFRPVTTEVVSFDAVPEACTAIAERRTRGRVVVEVTPGAAGQA